MVEPASHRRIHASCHCGNIRLTLDWPGAGPTIPVRACGCAFCVKHGAVWTSHPDGRYALRIDDERRLKRYLFGTRTAEFHICLTCGATPIAVSLIDGAPYAVVNVSCFDDVDRSELVEAATDFDGETTESRLARRQDTWTPRASTDGTEA